MSEFDDALQALDDAIYLFTKPGGGHTDTGKRLIAAKVEFKACRQALVTATLEQSGAIFQVQKLQAELLSHRHGAGDAEDAARYRWLRAEHAVNSPLAHVCWKQNGDRECGEWVNTASPESLDAAIDAAMHAPGGAGGGS